jgi:2-polyprenyl-6-methoxyphenol hydroxylase-like FAD-dependent oxidoreductase
MCSARTCSRTLPATIVRNAALGLDAIGARFVIAADGGSSPTRQRLDIGASGLPPTHRYRNLFFRADLTDLVRDRAFSQCQIANETARGLLVSINNTDQWTLHLELPAAHASVENLIRAAVGAPVDVQVVATQRVGHRRARRRRVPARQRVPGRGRGAPARALGRLRRQHWHRRRA